MSFLLQIAAWGDVIQGMPSPLASTSKNNAEWHAGNSVNTDAVNITYVEEYSTAEFSSGTRDRLAQTMTLKYLDGTMVEQGIQILIWFETGGLDLVNKKVLDWNKAMSIEPTLFVKSPDANGYDVQARQVFNGFSIFKGNASNLVFTNQTLSSGTYMSASTNLAESGTLATITMENATCKIGDVTITGTSYSYNGSTYNATTATFEMSLFATMSNGSVTEQFPITASFTMKHNITESSYKYGLDLDWWNKKAFDTAYPGSMSTGDDYLLLSNDLLEVFHDSASGKAGIFKQFGATNGNSTTVYKDGSQELCRQDLVKTYNVKNGSAGKSAKFYYFENGRYDEGYYGSNIFVAYEGFKYNESTGMDFDPTVTVPAFIQGGSDSGLGDIPGPSLLFVSLCAMASVVVIALKKVKHL
ncbi:MAG: hypothetical protein ACTSU5_19985 [Promethearchaeota archaeon]